MFLKIKINSIKMDEFISSSFIYNDLGTDLDLFTHFSFNVEVNFFSNKSSFEIW